MEIFVPVLLAIMVIAIGVFMAFSFGGFADIFYSKKRKVKD